MINRLNYEIWFLDFSEGNLNNEDKKQLFAFLDSNPDLKHELESFEIFKLENENTVFSLKDNLKKIIAIDMVEGLDEFEVLAIKKVEGEISQNEIEVLDHLVEISDSRKKELDAFEKTKLFSDEKLNFAHRESLKKRSGIVRLIYNYSASIAAAVLIIIFFTSIFNTGEDGNDKSIVSESKDEKSIPNSALASNDLIKPDNVQDEIAKNLENSIVFQNKLRNSDLNSPAIVNSSGTVKNNSENQNEITAGSRIATNLKTLNSESTTLGKSPMMHYIDYSAGKNPDIAINDNSSIVKALTPKEFFIKTVKNKLNMEDNDYSSLNTMDVVSAAVDKSKIASLDFSKNETDNSREFAFNIGSLSFSRKWTRE